MWSEAVLICTEKTIREDYRTFRRLHLLLANNPGQLNNILKYLKDNQEPVSIREPPSRMQNIPTVDS